jgi:hypothetical protein
MKTRIELRTQRILTSLALAAAVMIPHLTLAAGPLPVTLRTAGRFAILAGTAISSPTVGGIIIGDVGLSPHPGSDITGLTAILVNGTIYETSAGGPAGSVVDPGLLTTAKVDLVTAYLDAAGRTVNPIPVSGDIGGEILVPGLYRSASSLELSGTLTLDAQGDPNAVWIFQIASSLTTASGVGPQSQVVLANGAQAKNIFWQVGSSATIGTYSVFKGTILALTSITLNAGSSLEGRALARNGAVTTSGIAIGLLADVGDFVWLDTNPNGIQNAGEPGVANVVVNLYNTNSIFLATTNTDANGLYLFSDLTPGGYFLEFMLPSGYQFTLPGQDGVARGSDANPVTGETVPFTLFAGQSDTNWDAGLTLPGPAIGLVKTAGNAPDSTPLYVLSGSNVVYTYQIINAGDTYLIDVTLSDDILGPVGTVPGIVPPGATNFLYATNLITASVTNIGTVVGTPADSDGQPLTQTPNVRVSDDAVVLVIGPGVSIVKTAGNAPEGDVLYVIAGSNVVYTYQIVNSGDTYLANVVVTDDVLGVVGTIVEPMAPGATNFLYATNMNVTASIINIGTVVGTLTDANGAPLPGVDNVQASNTASVAVVGPGLAIVKTAGEAADGAIFFVLSGANVPYTYMIVNLGDTYLVNVTVTDSVLGVVGTIAGVMAPGATNFLYATNLNVTASVTNIGTAVGTPSNPNGAPLGVPDVTAQDNAIVQVDLFLFVPPQIIKIASADPIEAGHMLIYTITVVNASISATVSNVTVVETYPAFYRFISSSPLPRSGTSNIWDLGDLPPGFTTNIVIRGKVTKLALGTKRLLNTAEVFSDWGNRVVTLSTRVVGIIPVTLLDFRAVTVAGGVKLKWETATEFENLGFNLYRATSVSGTRIKVNATLVAGSASSDGAAYKYVDAAAKPGKTYYYWLEEVAWNFKTTTYGPAIRTGTATAGAVAGTAPALGVFSSVRAGGLYRITFEALQANGFAAGTLNLDTLAIRVNSRQIPVFVSAEGSRLKPGDFLLFYVPSSKKGLACAITTGTALPMALAGARPVRTAGDVYIDQAGANLTIAFKTDPSVVRYFLQDFTGMPVWLVDVTDPAAPILLGGFAYTEIANGLTAVYLSYGPKAGSANCLAVQDDAVQDVTRILKP